MASSHIKLVPTFRLLGKLDPTVPFGPLPTGGTLKFTNVPSGKLEALGDVGATLCTEDWVFYGDWMTVDPDGKHVRLDVRAIGKDTSGGIFNFEYTGIITMTSELQKVFTRAPDSATTSWDCVAIVAKFQGSGNVTELQNSLWAGSGRFVVDDGVAVEYIISRVVPTE